MRLFMSMLMPCVLSICTACAGLTPAQVGDDLDAVRAHRGPPSVETTAADGSTRLIYATAPLGQVAYAVTARHGKVVAVQQVLTREEFAQVRVGVDDRAAVLAHFGPPAETTRLDLTPREVWIYRMKMDDVFPALMHVQFDDQGIVRELVVGLDPLRDPGEWARD